MSYQRDIDKFLAKANKNIQLAHAGAARSVLDSVKYGSGLTGSPGQPIGEGDLRESWTMEPLGPVKTRIFTNSLYAESNEDGIARPGGGPYRLRSSEGGRWSVHKTRTHFQAIVDYIADKISRGRTAK